MGWIAYLPRAALGRLVGWVAEWQWPQPLRGWALAFVVRLLGIDLGEAEHQDPARYRSVQELFTRRLRVDARPLGVGVLLSPADGELRQLETVEGDPEVSLKQLGYRLSELCLGQAAEPGWAAAWMATVYLAPHNYHRVHTPVSGILRKMVYLPGDRYPVFPRFVALMPDLFVRNERLVFELETDQELGRVYVVMVGALNVAKLQTPYWDNLPREAVAAARSRVQIGREVTISLTAGDELGTFALGSTVVVVGTRYWDGIPSLAQPRRVKMGEVLG